MPISWYLYHIEKDCGQLNGRQIEVVRHLYQLDLPLFKMKEIVRQVVKNQTDIH